jgi:hypothetical protein
MGRRDRQMLNLAKRIRERLADPKKLEEEATRLLTILAIRLSRKFSKLSIIRTRP